MNAVKTHVQNLSKKMGTAQALLGVSTVFEAGEVHGIIGPNGAGKTTLLRLLCGLLTPGSGEISFEQDGHSVGAAQIKACTGYFPQEPSLYPDLSCQEHLEFFRDLYNIPQPEFERRADELFTATNMTPFRARPAGKLSGGMYKKLGLMCVLLNRPNLLLLDEPTVGVDPVSRQQLWDLVYEFAGLEMTVVLSTSYMDEARRCARIHVLEEGHLLASGAPQELLKRFEVKDIAQLFLKNNDEHN